MSKIVDLELIVVGDELLKGERRDAHMAYVGRETMRIGVRLNRAHVVGDNQERIAALVRDRVREARVIIVSGGLGPTHDDVTREGVSDGLGLPLEFDDAQWRVIQEIFRRFGREADASNRRQAYFPAGAEPIANPNGTAAGFVVERGGTTVFVLPGPPRELRPMMEAVVLERLRRLFARPPLLRETIRTTGIGESDMANNLRSLVEHYGDFVDISSLPHLGGVDIVVTQRVPGDQDVVVRVMSECERELRANLGARVYGKGEEPIEKVVGDALIARGETLAVAESLTGGLLAKSLTDIAGSSRYFMADIVAYSNEAKVTFLGVGEDTLLAHGAVSDAVCREMAIGVRSRTAATYGLATTGIAGPDGGTSEKPVGLTYYGIAGPAGAVVRHRIFPGDRIAVRERVRFACMLLLLQQLHGERG